MTRWRAVLMLLGALVYVVVPWDLDFVPVFGRLDDLLVLFLALAYWWRRKKMSARSAPGGPGGRTDRSTGEDRAAAGARDEDPYRILGVGRGASEEAIREAYRDLIGRYHPDRVHHLGEEFRQLAARRTVTINGAYERIKRERAFS